MKKIFISLFLFSLFCLNTFAQEEQKFTMPNDSDIENVINSFNFDKSQKEFLIKETKKRLTEFEKNPELFYQFIENGNKVQNSNTTK